MKLRFSNPPFTLASGAASHFRLEADTEGEDRETLDAMARVIAANVEPFDAVIGVPRGGVALAQALVPYITRGAERDLVVDDVWTTGLSINRALASRVEQRPFCAAVVWNRGSAPKWVFRLFDVHGLSIADARWKAG